MTLTKKSVETLIDLVEIKLSCIEVFDGQDGQTVNRLEQCRRELYGLMGKEPPRDGRLTLNDSAVA
jgi:hypothetical protein